MKVGKDYFAESKSSFLSLDKDLSLIFDKLLENQNLLKMLFYTEKDCLLAPNLTGEQKLSLLHNQIKIIPKINIQEQCPNFIIVTFDNFTPNNTNPEFRDCTINFDILCHPDHWNLGNFALRPYKIAGEIDAMFNKQKLTGIGYIELITGDNLVINDQVMGISLIYKTIHGVEDQIDPLV